MTLLAFEIYSAFLLAWLGTQDLHVIVSRIVWFGTGTCSAAALNTLMVVVKQ